MGFSVTKRSEQKILSTILDHALAEDFGRRGDITSKVIFRPNDITRAVIRSKFNGILSGISLVAPLFSKIDRRVRVRPLLRNGAALAPGTEICTLAGPVRTILAGERTALNFLQRLSGIATLTARYAGAIAHTRARLLDTRKTTPGLRLLEKQAVVHGGGCNHRFGLYDMMLIKDTHVKRAGGIAQALGKTLRARGKARTPKIEIEVQTIPEFEQALVLGPDRIMLDNMSVRDMRACVEKVLASGATVELEASGNITLETIAAIAETGVDFISCGAVTHSAPALDIHLLIT